MLPTAAVALAGLAFLLAVARPLAAGLVPDRWHRRILDLKGR